MHKLYDHNNHDFISFYRVLDDCKALVRISNCRAEDEDIASALVVETIRSNDEDRKSILENDMVGPLAKAYSKTCKDMKSGKFW